MKLTQKMWIILLIIAFVVTTLTFLIPFIHTPVFWIGIGCTWAMFGITAGVYYYAFHKRSDVFSYFLGWPIYRVSLVSLVVQVIFGFVLNIFSSQIPLKVAIFTELLIFAATCICLVFRGAARDTVNACESSDKSSSTAFRSIRTRVEVLIACTEDENMKESLKRISDELRYSDPTHHEIDEAILSAVSENDLTFEDIQGIRQLLKQRNAEIKTSKKAH